jgi:hypothetical protein
MNKKTIVASLAEIANTLDINNLHKEASDITKVMVKVAQEDKANQAVYNVLKRMTGRPDYNKMENLGQFINKNYNKLLDAVEQEAEKIGADVSEAIMRLDKASTGTRERFVMPVRNRQPGVGVPPSTVSPDQSTGEMESEDDRIYRQEKLPIFNLAEKWIKNNGNKGANQAKKDAYDQMKAGKLRPGLYDVIVELLQGKINQTPARPSMMGPTRRDK